jgi:hypothetical protein
MKTTRVSLLVVLPFVGLTSNLCADDELPQTQNFARYGAMLKHSPFAVATAAAPVATAPDFAKDLYVANVAHTPDGDLVSIASTTDKNLKLYLNTKTPMDGYTVSNIEWSDHVGETKVTISKNGQFATLTFNEALLSQGIQNQAPQLPLPMQQPAGVPGRPQPNLPIPRPGVTQPIPTPPPHVRPPIRRKTPPQIHPPAQPNDEPDE